MGKREASGWFDEAPVDDRKPEEFIDDDVTMESHLRQLARIRDSALGDGNYSAAVSAEIARAKHSGIVKPDPVDVVRHEFGLSPATLELLGGIRRIERVVHDAG